MPVRNAGAGSAINNAISRVGQPLIIALLFIPITAVFYGSLTTGGERALFGVRTADGWPVPRFQLRGHAPLPGFRAVVGALPPGIHPVAFHTWFTSPTGSLRLDDAPVSPRDWLASGGPADVVAAQAAAL